MDKNAAAKVMRTCLEALRAIGVYIRPILPNASRKIDAMLSVDTSSVSWDDGHKIGLASGAALGEIVILFAKLEDEQIQAEIKRMEEMAAKAEKVTEQPVVQNEHIKIDDFKKIKLRTAKVVEAERVPKSKKLLKLQVTLGDEKRQIVAGIAEKYAPEDIIGKTIVVVANLESAKLMGIESQGMLLAVNDEKGVVTLVTSEGDAKDGLEVR
jgi:methionyl-tRNA synthetase